MNLIYLILAVLLLVVLAPLLVIIFVGVAGLKGLELSLGAVLFLLLLMFFCSFFNIPLGKRRYVKTLERSFFGFRERLVWRSQGVSINVGGALIPLLIVGYFLPSLPLQAFLITTAVVAFFSFMGARFIEERGLAISMVLPVLFAVLFSIMLSPETAPEMAFSSGVLGVLIGADLLYLPWVLKKSGGVISIGGAGIFDGIFLVGVVSAFLAGL